MLQKVKAKGLGNKERFEQASANFFINAMTLHHSKYDYSDSVYNGYTKNFTYHCPIHGEREQTPVLHLKTVGCAKCAQEKAAKVKIAKAAEKYFARANDKHDFKFNYDNSVYTGTANDIIYYCPLHGERTQNAGDHLRSGCRVCGDERQATRSFLKAQKKFFLKINKNDYLNYSESVYYGALSPFTFTCPIHGKQTQCAHNHLAGSGCPECTEYGFNPGKPAILYYLKHIKSGYYKSGITNRTVEERFEKRAKEFKILNITEFEIGFDARQKEKEILEEFKEYNFTFEDFSRNGGSEFFNKDILNLDKGIQ